ncbi:MAG: 4a-hydroxytetrahydrobiopterin dehydratase [Dehalococcoidia bacterium]|nr:MAG: 4a-hydroxytetrahydrobiopterin dehydratase [Dehalococcoidia bacterium]
MATSRRRLTDAEIDAALAGLPGWRRDANRLVRDFQFVDFVEALGFIAQVGALAERVDHHPELTNVYNRVTIALSTHDAGGVTPMDLALAAEIGTRGT